MIGRRPRMLSQRSYQLLQDIHRENDRLRQVDQGMGLRPADRLRVRKSLPAPVDGIGPVIDAVRAEDGNWRAA